VLEFGTRRSSERVIETEAPPLAVL
jgi:hypothetical protein